MKYRIKYLIEAEIKAKYLRNYYVINNGMNDNGEIEIEIKDNDKDMKNYSCIIVTRDNKTYIAISEDDLIKFKEYVNNSYEYYSDRLRLVRDVIIEEIIG